MNKLITVLSVVLFVAVAVYPKATHDGGHMMPGGGFTAHILKK